LIGTIISLYVHYHINGKLAVYGTARERLLILEAYRKGLGFEYHRGR